MSSNSALVVKRRARQAFWRGRLVDALPELLIATILLGVGLVWSSAPERSWIPGVVLLCGAFGLSLWGGAVRRMILPALFLGAIPLVCSLGSQSFGHVCTPQGCYSVCVLFCCLGGVVAGVLLARAARFQERPWLSWLVGGSVVVCVGSLGCVCVGASGVVGMSLGVLTSAGILAWPVPRKG